MVGGGDGGWQGGGRGCGQGGLLDLYRSAINGSQAINTSRSLALNFIRFRLLVTKCRPHLRPGASGNLCVWQMSCLYIMSTVKYLLIHSLATFNKAIRQHLSPLSGCKAGKQKWFSLATERHSPQLYFLGTKETLKSILRFSIHRTLLFFSFCHRKKHQFQCWGQRILERPFSGYF